MKRVLLILPILLMSCAKPETPAQSVFLAESDYSAALKIELAYSALPRCPKAKLCSDVSIIKKVQAADNVAYVALRDAQTAVRTPGYGDSKITTVVASATALVKAFVEITNTLGAKS